MNACAGRFGLGVVILLVAAAASSSPAAAAASSPGRCAHASSAPSHLSTRAATHALQCLINAVRLQHGMRPVRYDGRLSAAARRHAWDMADHDFFDHVSPTTGSL